MRRPVYFILGVIACGGLGLMVINELKILRELDDLRASAKRGAVDTTNSAGSTIAGARGPALAADDLRSLARAVAAASAAPSDEPPAQPGKARPERQLTQEEVQENVLTAYAKETNDATWSREASRKLDGSIRPALPVGSRLVSIDCRSTMCLVEVQHQDEKAAQSWLLNGFHDWPGAVMVAGEKEEGGAILQTLVPIKEGTVPPYAGM